MDALATLPKYEAYKDSGVDWLDLVPEKWELTRLGTRFFERRNKVSDIDYPALSVTKKGILPQLESAAKTKDGDNRKLVKAGDFVINSRSDRKGSSGVSDRDGSVSLINIVLEPNGIHPKFSEHLLKSYAFVEEYYRVGRGIVADLWTTRYDEMRTVVLAVPSYKEQEAIANFLDQKTTQIDEAIAIKEKQIALLKERKQIIIQKAVTQGLNPNVPMKDSGVEWIGKIPAHWSITKLKFYSKIQSGITLGKSYAAEGLEEIPYLRVANVQFGYFKLNDVSTLQIPKGDISRYLLKYNDVLVTEGGDIDKLGRGTVWKSEIETCIHQNHVFAIRINEKRLKQDYVANYLASDSARKHFIYTATKTTNLASTNRTHLGNTYLPMPDLEEQDKINSFIEKSLLNVEGAVANLEEQIQKLKEYKTTLINSAVTGKIKVA